MLIEKGKKMKKKLLSLILCSALVLSSNFSLLEVNAAEMEVQQNVYDTQVIPDIYNTGCKGELTPWREYFNMDPSAESLYITLELQQTYGTQYNADIYGVGYKFSNVDFSDVTVNLNKAGLTNITFENCYFGSNGTNNVAIGSNWTDTCRVDFKNCTFTNSKSASVKASESKHLFYDRCLFYGIYGSAIVANKNTYITNCYFHSIGVEGQSSNAVLNGVNTFQSFLMINCRINSVSYDGVYPNSCISLKNVTATATNGITIQNVYMSGGHYSVYLSIDETIESSKVSFANIQVGNASQYSSTNLTASDEIRNLYDNAEKDIDSLHVSSVYTEDNKMNLVVSNYTGDTRDLLMITNNGSYKTTIKACPDYDESLNCNSLKEFPFDLEVTLPENPEYVVCYDVTDVSNPKQVRFVNNTENAVMVDIESSLAVASEIDDSGSLLPDITEPDSPDEPATPSEPMDGNIDFKANIDSWFEVKIPNSYKLTDLTNELEFSVSGDIAGDKLLSVTTEESIVLKNANEDELVATLNMTKKSFAFAELKDITDSAIVIEVEKLPAGRFVGEMPVYVSIIDAEESIPDGVITGQINETVNYRLENGTFTVSGTGGMSDYYYTYENYRDQIVTAVIEDGIDCVGLSSFQDCSNLETVYLGNDVSVIKGYAFKRCSNIKSVYMPTSVTEVVNGAFVSNNTNTTIYYAGTEEQFNQITGVENMAGLTIVYNQTW